MPENMHFKYITKTGDAIKRKKGRPRLNEDYVFSNKEYLRIILLIYTCEIYDKKPPLNKSLIKMIDEYNFAKYRLKLNPQKYDDIISSLT